MSGLPDLGRRGEGWFGLQLLLLGAVLVSGIFFGPNWAGAARFASAVAGLVLIGGGIGLALLGTRDLGPSLSPMPRPTDEAVLVESGVYRRIRHPIYLGVAAAALGWGLLTASLVAIVLAIALVTLLDLKARREEAWLRERFAGYPEYVRRTRRFVPGIY